MEGSNLAQLIVAELRRRGEKSVKSVFWNSDAGNLSVFPKAGTPEKPMSFNYAPDVSLSVEEIVDYIVERCSAEGEDK